MTKESINKVCSEMEFLVSEGFSFHATFEGLFYTKTVPEGHLKIIFLEQSEHQSLLDISLSIRIDRIENVVNYYKHKHDTFNLEFAKDSTTVSIFLNRILDKPFSLDYNENSFHEFEDIYYNEIRDFFVQYGNSLGCEKIINNTELIEFLEPFLSIYKVVLSKVNGSDTFRIIKKCVETVERQNNMTIKFYKPVFDDIVSKIENNLQLETLN